MFIDYYKCKQSHWFTSTKLLWLTKSNKPPSAILRQCSYTNQSKHLQCLEFLAYSKTLLWCFHEGRIDITPENVQTEHNKRCKQDQTRHLHIQGPFIQTFIYRMQAVSLVQHVLTVTLGYEILSVLQESLAELWVAMLMFDQLNLLSQHARVKLGRSLKHLCVQQKTHTNYIFIPSFQYLYLQQKTCTFYIFIQIMNVSLRI